MRRIINFRSSKTRMMILALVDIATMIMNSYLALILRHEGHYSWIDDKYINSIQSYMIINIVTTLIIFILLKLFILLPSKDVYFLFILSLIIYVFISLFLYIRQKGKLFRDFLLY